MSIELGENGVKINGKEEILLCASFFYFRIPKKEWASRAKLISSLGYNCVDIYFPWNFHEREPGIFDFSEERDVDCFLKICEENNLYVVARPGPYICSEWDGGALPAWVLCDYEIRQNNERYLYEVRKWFDKILPIIQKHQIGGNENGSVIFLQLENELDFFDCDDVEGYIEKLKIMASDNEINVPMIVCAGQGDIKRSGGLTKGVVPTYNFYPSLSDETFDHNLSLYSKFIRKKGLPFLVSETDRKHCILKREMLAGAKLLAAYNQISGTNFDYYQSVNNWGTPLSLICTLYDFDGIIDNLGHCTKEADEALLLSQMIRLYGQKLAAGEYYELESPFSIEEKNVAFTNAISLSDDGGKLICVRSVEDGAVNAQCKYEGNDFEVSLDSFEALALPLHLKFDDYEIVFSNNEIYSFKPLVFIRRSKPFLIIQKNGKRIAISESGIYEEIEVSFISKEEAISKIKEERKLEITYCKELFPIKIENCLVGNFENNNYFTKAKSSLFSDNKIWYGEVEYKIKTNDRKLFLKGVGDFLTVKNNDEVVFSGLCACDDVIVDGMGEVRAVVEKWGHSNFDDARKNSLRIKTKRGIEKIYEIISESEITRWTFTEVDSFSKNVEIKKSEADPHISINSWNSTREPLFAAYYTEIIPDAQLGEEIILFLDGMEAECNLFINGKFVFKFTQSSRSVNITKLVHSNEKTLIELCVRKPDWAIKTGNLSMLKVVPCEFEIRKVNHLDTYNSTLKAGKLPLILEKGKMYSLCIEKHIPYDTYGFAKGSGFRATIMQNRKVIARIVAKHDKIFQAGCSDSSKFFIPSGEDSKLYFFIEAMDDGKFEFIIGEADKCDKININIKSSQQIIDGWGTSLCWWANAAGGWTMKDDSGKEKREKLMQLFFSEDGLNFNIVRYNIGGGDNPDEKQHMFHFRGIPCYKAMPDSRFDKNADWRQIWVLKRAHEIRKGDLVTEVFVNSPPWWMTKSLCSSGNIKAIDENLDRSRYEEFIEYCIDVLEYLHNDLEIKTDYFEPMNEAASDYWAKGQRQEGNKVNQGESQSKLLTVAYEKLRQRRLEAEITGTDETNPTVALKSYNMLSEKVKETILKKINYHHYATDDDALKQLQQITYKDGYDKPKYKLWMDEVCYGDGNDDLELAKRLITAIHSDLNIAHANGWVIWQAVDSMTENIISKCHWGLIEGLYQDKNNNELEGIPDVNNIGFGLGDYIITTQYYVMGHYSKYIKRGYSILENDGEKFSCISAISPDKNTVVVVLYNDENQNKTVLLNLDEFVPQKATKIVTCNERKWDTSELTGNFTSIELEAKSITTLEFVNDCSEIKTLKI